MFIVFIGPPGAGKGTQSKRLVAHLQIPHLSTGEMLRAAKQAGSPQGVLAGQYMDAGRLVPDTIVMKVVALRLTEPDCGHGCLFDGFPRTLPQAKSLDQLLVERGTPLTMAIELHADENELIRRMLKRATQEKRVDDNPATIAKRMEVYFNQTAPLLEYYRAHGLLESVDAMGTPEAVFDAIKERIESRRAAAKT